MTAPAAGPDGAPPAPRPQVRQNLLALLVLLIAAGGLLVASTLIFLPFVAPIALALVVATTGFPLFQRVQMLTGAERRGAASAITCLILVLIVFLPLSWVGWSLANQVPTAVNWTAEKLKLARVKIDESSLNERPWFRETWASAKKLLDRLEGDTPAVDPAAGAEIPQAAPDAGPAAADPGGRALGPGDSLIRIASGAATAVITNAFEFALKFVLMLFLLFFFLKDGPQILQSLKRAIPLEEKYQDRVIRTFRQVTRSIIRGSFGTAFAQGAIATIAYAIAGLPAIFWGAITTICALIPPFGTTLVTIPVIVFLLVDGHWGKGIFIGVVAMVIGLLDNVLRPWLMQGSLKVHPIWILLSVLGALKLFGPAGIIFGPMILALLGTIVALLVEEERAEAAAHSAQGPAGAPP
jgi:predicted PurR-regulated permease PerM